MLIFAADFRFTFATAISCIIIIITILFLLFIHRMVGGRCVVLHKWYGKKALYSQLKLQTLQAKGCILFSRVLHNQWNDLFVFALAQQIWVWLLMRASYLFSYFNHLSLIRFCVLRCCVCHFLLQLVSPATCFAHSYSRTRACSSCLCKQLNCS